QDVILLQHVIDVDGLQLDGGVLRVSPGPVELFGCLREGSMGKHCYTPEYSTAITTSPADGTAPAAPRPRGFGRPCRQPPSSDPACIARATGVKIARRRDARSRPAAEQATERHRLPNATIAAA